MPSGVSMTLHVIHVAAEALGEPGLKARKVIGGTGSGDTHQLKAERAGLLFQAIFKTHQGKPGGLSGLFGR